MKVSLNWVKEFTQVDLPIDELIEKIGAQLGAIDEVIDLGKRYEGIVVARVASCEKHPNANKLKVCMVDDAKVVRDIPRNEHGLVQVVCGAPNVAEGQLVAWIPPGSTVPSTYEKDPFVIESREIRGVMSNGMLASPKELALGDNHEGLLIIDKEAKPGEPLAKIYGLDDYVIDIENKMFTHRPDCFGMLGIARELAGITGHSFESPDWYKKDITPQLPDSEGTPLKLGVKNELPKLVPRFCVVAMRDLEVKPSPIWLQSKLSRVGIRPINNIVDITNFFMLETGQPLHAYDYDKLKSGTVGVRLSKEGESLKILGGKEVKLQAGAIVITDGQRPIGLGGVMGGAETEVDENTKNIVLECASFDMNTIRKTAMHYGLFTDAATRFTKGQSPLQNLAVITKVIDDVQKIAGGKVASKLLDEKTVLPGLSVVKTSLEFINSRLGLELSTKEIKQLLENVEFKVQINGKQLLVTAPFWRTDIETPEDIVEEVGRLYGYDHLNLKLPIRDLTPPKLNESFELKSRLREILSRGGANEVLTYSFVHGSLLKKVGQNAKLAYQIRNALSPDLQYYRLSLTPSLLEKIHPNIKLGYSQFAVFEINKAHSKARLEDDKSKLPKEFELLALVFGANDKAAAPSTGAAFYKARFYLDFLAREFGISLEYVPVEVEPKDQIMKPYEPERSALVRVQGTQEALGVIGEFRAPVIHDLKLPRFSAGFEIDIEKLAASAKAGREYQPLPRFPKVEQDISLRAPDKLGYGQLFDFAQKTLDKIKPKNSLVLLEPVSIYKKSENESHKTITLRLTITSYERTLTTAEVSHLLDRLASEAHDKFNVDRT